LESSVFDGSVLVVGVGGLGAPAASALVRAGAKRLGLIDPDPVELSNLARQVIYETADIGHPKVEAAARRLGPGATGIAIYPCALDLHNATAIVARYDFIIDATDDPAAKFLINDACAAAGRPYVYAGVLGLTGQAMTVIPGVTACLRCLFEAPPDPAEIATCREAGIIGPVAGAIGEIQAAEATAWLDGKTPDLAGRILTYDARDSARIRVTDISPRPGCGCGAATNSDVLPVLAGHNQ